MPGRADRPALPADVPFGADLVPGARNAVGTCLRLAPGERVALITDRATEETAAALAAEVRAVGAALYASILHTREDLLTCITGGDASVIAQRCRSFVAECRRRARELETYSAGWVAGLARLSDLTGLGAGGA